MNAMKLLSIMPKYNNCPQCGSDKIGNGEGAIFVEDNTYTRACKCGFKITVDEDGKEVEPDNYMKSLLKRYGRNKRK